MKAAGNGEIVRNRHINVIRQQKTVEREKCREKEKVVHSEIKQKLQTEKLMQSGDCINMGNEK